MRPCRLRGPSAWCIPRSQQEAETALLLLLPIASHCPAAECTQRAAAYLQLIVLLLAIQMMHSMDGSRVRTSLLLIARAGVDDAMHGRGGALGLHIDKDTNLISVTNMSIKPYRMLPRNPQIEPRWQCTALCKSAGSNPGIQSMPTPDSATLNAIFRKSHNGR